MRDGVGRERGREGVKAQGNPRWRVGASQQAGAAMPKIFFFSESAQSQMSSGVALVGVARAAAAADADAKFFFKKPATRF